MADHRNSWCIAFLLVMAVLAGLLVACDRMTSGGPLPTPTPPPTPELRTPSPVVAEPNRRQSVVLVSIGGASAEALSDWMANGDMPALSHLVDRGWAAPLGSVSPPLPGLALAVPTTGSTSPDAEPIWQRAAQHHRLTALLFWPGADPTQPDRRADYTLSCAPSPTATGQQTVTLSLADLWAGAPVSFSPPYDGVLAFPSPTGAAPWRVLAVDTTDDDQTAYDAFFFAPHSDNKPAVDRNTKRLTLDEWATLPVSGPGLMLTVTGHRTLTRTVTLSPTTKVTTTTPPTLTATITPTAVPETLLELTLYQASVQPVVARPGALSREVIERFGFCPPLPDPTAVLQGQLSAAGFRGLAERRARWAMRVASYVYETTRPHLLMVHQDVLAVSEQALLLADSRQPGYSPKRAVEFENHRRAVTAAVDDGLDDLLAVVDLNYASVLIASAYGTAPIHTQANVFAALQPAWEELRKQYNGLLRGDPSLHIYVEGVFLSVEIGSDWDEGYDVAIDTIYRELTTLTDIRTGEPVFAHVARRENAGSWSSTWPYPGDLFAQTAIGYLPSATFGANEVFSEAPSYGQTGYVTRLPSTQGALIVAGRGVFEKEAKSSVRLQDVAPMAVELLGLPASTDDPQSPENE